MSLMFATRNPTESETRHLRALLSTFRDGSGYEKESDGSTRPGWREIERCVAELALGPASENKHIFDVIAPDDANPNIFYGLSIKSKELSKRRFLSLPTTGRVYMELSNSPAKFWLEIERVHGHTEREFSRMEHPQAIGNTVLETVINWHREGKESFEARGIDRVLDLENSRYLCVSYSKERNPNNRLYQIHSFPLDFPENVRWEYTSRRCLKGYDPCFPNEVLFEWYGSSGGQLKYYPRAVTSIHRSEVFGLLQPQPPLQSLTDKAMAYFPDEFSFL